LSDHLCLRVRVRVRGHLERVLFDIFMYIYHHIKIYLKIVYFETIFKYYEGGKHLLLFLYELVHPGLLLTNGYCIKPIVR